MSCGVSPAELEAGSAATGDCSTIVCVLRRPVTPSARKDPATTRPPSSEERIEMRTSDFMYCLSCSVGIGGEFELNRQFSTCGLDVGRAHQRLPDEHRMHPCALELVELGASSEPRLGYHCHAIRYVRQELVGPPGVNGQ